MAFRWTSNSKGGPRRVNHAAVSVGEDRVFSFGGYCTGENYRDKERAIDIFLLNAHTLRWIALPPPDKHTGQCVRPEEESSSSDSKRQKVEEQEQEQQQQGEPAVEAVGAAQGAGAAQGVMPAQPMDLDVAAEPEAPSLKPFVWPYQRYGHTVSLYGDHEILLFGGRNDDSPCNILYVFDTRTFTWSRPTVSGTIPPERDGHSACVIGDALYIYGGYEESNQRFGEEVYKLDLKTMVWTMLQVGGMKPAYRDFHTATAIGHCMYVFGGRSDLHQANGGGFMGLPAQAEYYTNKISFLDTKTNTWHSPLTSPCPMGRRSHSALNLAGKLLIFGGYNGVASFHLHDLWLFDPDATQWKELKPYGEGPCARRRQAMCKVGNQIVLFGGTSPYDGPPIDYTEEQRQFIPDQDVIGLPLVDHNDMYVLDLDPTLRTLCIDTCVKYKLIKTDMALPRPLLSDIVDTRKDNTITKALPVMKG